MQPPSATVTASGPDTAKVFSFSFSGIKGETGPTGATGEKGETGATGPAGATGATPDFSIGTVTTGAAGSSASASITGTAENPVLNLTIPRGDTGETGATGQTGQTGAAGASAGFGTPTITVGSNTGTPSASVTASGPDTGKVFSFSFDGLKGETGASGAAAGFGSPSATVGTGTGTPSVTVTASGPDSAKVFSFAFDGLKGAAGQPGAAGQGVPAGGSAGQILAKKTGTDYDTEWINETGNQVFYATITGPASSLVSDKTFAEVKAAIDAGMAVYAVYGQYVFSLYSYTNSDIYFEYTYISGLNVINRRIRIYLVSGNTRVYHYDASVSVPQIPDFLTRSVLFSAGYDSEEQKYYVQAVPSYYVGYTVGDIGEFFSYSSVDDAFVFLESGSSEYSYDWDEEQQAYVAHNASQGMYVLTNKYTTSVVVDDDAVFTGHLVFTNIGNVNGTMKARTFEVSEEIGMYDGFDSAVVTYSEVSLGQAPSAQGQNF